MPSVNGVMVAGSTALPALPKVEIAKLGGSCAMVPMEMNITRRFNQTARFATHLRSLQSAHLFFGSTSWNMSLTPYALRVRICVKKKLTQTKMTGQTA